MVAQGSKFSHGYPFNGVASYSTKFNLDAVDALESMKALGVRAVVLYRKNKLE
jgi:hypothetical protein